MATSALEGEGGTVASKAWNNSRWTTASGFPLSASASAKSTKPGRIAENIDVFDVELSAAELAAIDRLDTGVRGGPEPEAITLESAGRAIPEDCEAMETTA